MTAAATPAAIQSGWQHISMETLFSLAWLITHFARVVAMFPFHSASSTITLSVVLFYLLPKKNFVWCQKAWRRDHTHTHTHTKLVINSQTNWTDRAKKTHRQFLFAKLCMRARQRESSNNAFPEWQRDHNIRPIFYDGNNIHWKALLILLLLAMVPRESAERRRRRGIFVLLSRRTDFGEGGREAREGERGGRKKINAPSLFNGCSLFLLHLRSAPAPLSLPWCVCVWERERECCVTLKKVWSLHPVTAWLRWWTRRTTRYYGQN